MFRDEQFVCPSCNHALIPQPGGPTRLWCEACRGVLIPTDEVEALLAESMKAPFTLPAGTPGERQCPRCPMKLARFTLFGKDLDRCEGHGVWFDVKEFLFVLEASTGVDPNTIEDERHEPNVLRRLLDKLFGDPRAVKRPK